MSPIEQYSAISAMSGYLLSWDVAMVTRERRNVTMVTRERGTLLW